MANTLLDNLLAAWLCNEASGTRFDAHTNSYDMPQSDGTVTATAGINGDACKFGTDTANKLSRADDGTFDLGATSFSVGCWFQQVGNQNNPMLGKHDGVASINESWVLWQRSTNDRVNFTVSDDGTSTTTEIEPATGTTPDNTWNFVTAGFDIDSQEIWIQINAVDRNTAAHTTGIFIANVKLTMGWFLGTGDIMGNHDQDETYVWDRYITSDEHDVMYNGGTGVFFSSFESASGGNGGGGGSIASPHNRYRRRYTNGKVNN